MECKGQSARKTPVSYWGRHLRAVAKYGSFKKYRNLARAYSHYLKGTARIPTMPSFLKVEISRKCQVHCKYCFPQKADTFYPLSLYKQLIDRLGEYLFEVSLYDIGEPLQNGDVVQYIKYAHTHNIGTILSTSLSVQKERGFWKELVMSGLDRVIVAIDGISEEVYKKYRTNGDLNLVMSNLERLAHQKNAHNNGLVIEWQMIELPWNRCEQEPARRLARDMGCDTFRVIAEANLRRRQRPRLNGARKHNCLLPYLIFIVDAFNNVRACYKEYESSVMVGNLYRDSFEEIWNGEQISRIRDKHTIINHPPCCSCIE